jgi:hypothetical protein
MSLTVTVSFASMSPACNSRSLPALHSALR